MVFCDCRCLASGSVPFSASVAVQAARNRRWRLSVVAWMRDDLLQLCGECSICTCGRWIAIDGERSLAGSCRRGNSNTSWSSLPSCRPSRLPPSVEHSGRRTQLSSTRGKFDSLCSSCRPTRKKSALPAASPPPSQTTENKSRLLESPSHTHSQCCGLTPVAPAVTLILITIDRCDHHRHFGVTLACGIT